MKFLNLSISEFSKIEYRSENWLAFFRWVPTAQVPSESIGLVLVAQRMTLTGKCYFLPKSNKKVVEYKKLIK